MDHNQNEGGFKSWLANSITFKAIVVVFLMLLLLIPASMVQSIIRERQNLQQQATAEVSQKWSERQTLSGPILTVPFDVNEVVEEEVKSIRRYYHILPDDLDMKVEVETEALHRGIYKVVVYTSDIKSSGKISIDNIMDYNEDADWRFDEAFITLGISDVRGIQEELDFLLDNQKLNVEPGSRVPELIAHGITIPLGDQLEETAGQKLLPFSFELKLQGSQNLSFIPVGGTTNISMASAWPSPSFVGSFLPDNRDVQNDGFTADWNVLQLNRSFPQRFAGHSNGFQMQEAVYGVDFIIPLDDYQKGMRSVKYAGMTIALTFLIFFLVELLNRKKIHPLQYALVGLALCLFYVLLIALSEHMWFNYAFLVAAVAIVGMIGLYSLSVFKERRHSFLLILCLIFVYLFLFTTLQLADYALLLGSLGLFITLGLTMYFTRKIDWYHH